MLQIKVTKLKTKDDGKGVLQASVSLKELVPEELQRYIANIVHHEYLDNSMAFEQMELKNYYLVTREVQKGLL